MEASSSMIKVKAPTVKGKLIGYTKPWNPFANEIFARVEVDTEIINVPIDYRQQKFIQKEHPLNSLVHMIFSEGKWQILSQTIGEKLVLGEKNSVFV
jgi:hypothetical protein